MSIVRREPARFIGAIVATITILASTGLLSWLTEASAGVIITLLLTWAAAFGVSIEEIRRHVFSPATHDSELQAASAPTLDGHEVARGLRDVELERRELDRRERELRGVPDMPDDVTG